MRGCSNDNTFTPGRSNVVVQTITLYTWSYKTLAITPELNYFISYPEMWFYHLEYLIGGTP